MPVRRKRDDIKKKQDHGLVRPLFRSRPIIRDNSNTQLYIHENISTRIFQSSKLDQEAAHVPRTHIVVRQVELRRVPGEGERESRDAAPLARRVLQGHPRPLDAAHLAGTHPRAVTHRLLLKGMAWSQREEGVAREGLPPSN